jgi:glucose-6-phosphate 1-dehydrogenase
MQNVFVVFGITGDLMRKKGIPALFALYRQHALPPDFRIVGFSRKQWDTSTIRLLIQSALGEGVVQEELSAFASMFQIVQGEGSERGSYPALHDAIGTPASLSIYLCISPELYAGVIKNLGEEKLLSNPGTRILIEKPFGSSLESAQSLQKLLLQYAKEEQIYRIDHFLAKEAMLDLSSLSPDSTATIEVYLNEAFGVEKRGASYDPVGAFRDVGQNHLLESAAAVLGDRIKALGSLHILTPEEIKTRTMRAQHEGYKEIEGVKKDSQTETYFKVESWFEAGGRKIPVLLESGKLIPNRREVVVTDLHGNRKTIPFESGSNEYETLFKEAFAGERHRFVSIDEVEALWKFTDPIEESWKKGEPPLASYAPAGGAPSA